jgi:hypothetical protein
MAAARRERRASTCSASRRGGWRKQEVHANRHPCRNSDEKPYIEEPSRRNFAAMNCPIKATIPPIGRGLLADARKRRPSEIAAAKGADR